MKMGFNSADAVQYLQEAINNNADLTDTFDKASKDVADAFASAGDIVSGAVGIACSNCWGDGSSNFFKNKLLLETERFLFDKVQNIIGMANEYTDTTKGVYESGMKAVE